jgi:hypothetical protein
VAGSSEHGEVSLDGSLADFNGPLYVPNTLIRGTSTAQQSQKKSAVTALIVVLASAPVPIISQQTFLGSLSTDAYAGICLMICLADYNVLFLIVNFIS